jgi:inosine-uridine nucleoside N-ribohydrolase
MSLIVVAAQGSEGGGEMPKQPQRLIIDTDMSGDCDDVGAVCMAHALMDNGEAELLAVVSVYPLLPTCSHAATCQQG